ncbi:MAG: succinate dehydrogenase/fumarate reductase flavoprotein subunit [Nitrososphaerota archaeon]
MIDRISTDIVIVGSGLAGLRAAIEAASTDPKIQVAVLSKVHAMRSHSVAYAGGTAAVIYPEEGDSFDLHAFDTVKGSDYLADQDVVELFVRLAPREILRLEHWGMPWSRRSDGRIDQRPFGGHSFDRACYASDKTGLHAMQTLYNTCLKYDNITFYHEWFVTSILVEDNEFRGFTALEMKSGDLYVFQAKAGVLSTGGAGRLYSFTTYGHSATAEGMCMAYRVGIPLKDMEFIQFHPTGLVPSGILISEAARGEGGYLRNKEGERFMSKYAPERMELAPRDIVSRAMMREIMEGRGFEGPNGLDYVHLDLTHLGEEVINEKLTEIKMIGMKFAGINPVNEPLPVRPVAHYTMGGVHVDINGQTPVKGLWAAGEVNCVSIHGANRLGCNSTTDCLVYGYITGKNAAEYVLKKSNSGSIPTAQAEKEEKRIFDEILKSGFGDDPYLIRREMQSAMTQHAYVFRDGKSLEEGLRKIRELRKRFGKGNVADKSKEFNQNLINVLELDAMLEVAEVVLVSALARTESRGAHYRLDYPKRDDANWLKHTLAYRTPEGPTLEYIPVKITRWEPKERKY